MIFLKNVLIVGASGFLGKELYMCLKNDNNYNVFGTYLKNEISEFLYLDITNVENIRIAFENVKPQIVIIAAALTNVEYCETHKEEAYIINVIGVKNLVNMCKKHCSKVIYISTEYVFDGICGPYREDDKENPINYYGITKLLAENIIEDNIDNYLIARTTVVYGWDLRSKNFIMQLINNLSNNVSMGVPKDQISSPTYCPNLSNMIKEICDKNICGTFNLTGKDIIDRYTFACIAADALGLNKKLIIPISNSGLNQVAKRPLKAGLYINKVENILSTKPISIKNGLYEVKKLYFQVNVHE